MSYGVRQAAGSWRGLLLAIFLCLAWPWVAAEPAVVVLQDDVPSVDVWPAVTMRADPERRLTLQDVLAQRDRWSLPPATRGTLGMRQEPVWLRIPIEVATTTDMPWALEIDHHDLNRIEIYVVSGGHVVRQAVLGNLQPYSQRTLKTRAHTQALGLKTGAQYELLLRVETKGAMLLPIRLHQASALLQGAVDEQMLQGVLVGFALCLILYSLVHWLNLRDPLFIQYALMSAGSLLFIFHFHGIGSQYLWRDSPWIEAHVGGLSALVALTGSFLFIGQVLWDYLRDHRLLRAMRGGALLCAVIAVGYALDGLGSKAVANIVTLLGLVPVLMGLPGATRLIKKREPVGVALVLAWVASLTGTATVIGVIQGWLDMGFWTLHSFEFGAIIDMVFFMHILGLRSKALQRESVTAARERDAMNLLAHTDSLTGRLNRRGLNVALASALETIPPERLLAVYVMDLDGFKPVNDQHGHDVGDQLLQAVANRLQGHVRQRDVVARLGGDEFVVVANGLGSPAEADELARKLLNSFASPFRLDHLQVRVGLTIGYALAPVDGQDADGLLKLADAAMYSGKQSGKLCARRWQAQTGATAGAG